MEELQGAWGGRMRGEEVGGDGVVRMYDVIMVQQCAGFEFDGVR